MFNDIKNIQIKGVPLYVQIRETLRQKIEN